MGNIFNKEKPEKFLIRETKMPSRCRWSLALQQNQNRTYVTLGIQNKERIFKTSEEKHQVTYEASPPE
jgi:hypothetical protein